MSTAQGPDPLPADAARERRAPVRVGLVQINNSFSGQNYLPYSVALLQTYVQKMSADPGRYEFLPPLYKRVRIADAVEALKDADLVGFSTYVWNGRISLEIARRLKALQAGHRHRLRRPARAGPARGLPARQSPDRPRRPQRGRADVPEAARKLSRTATPGSRCRASAWSRPTARFVRNPNIDRVRDLDEIPSPFLEGAFDSIMAANPERELDRPVGDQPRLPVPLHLLRLGLGDRGQGHQVRRGAALPRGRLVRREEDRVHLLLRRQLRHPEARRRHRQLCRRHQEGDRLSGGAVGAEHQERHRARLPDAEDPVRRRPEQGRGALACRAST